jgi:tRNA(Ile)-lysidine synthase
MTPHQPSPTDPLGDAEADALLAPFAAFDAVLLAVSGGPDSIALMHLAAAWRLRRADPPAIVVATVDHRLRPEAAGEARTVAAAARALGLPHAVLREDALPPAGASQAWARELRYRLLEAHAAARWPAGRIGIATAHTRDDQAETILMRLARGSGLDGLAGIRPARPAATAGVTIVRPLLGIAKARLVATLRAIGASWIDDPSNTDRRFERPRQRAHAAARERLGLGDAALALAARRLARARDALDAAATAALAPGGAVAVSPLGSAELDWAALLLLPAEVRLRVLARLLAAIGASGDPVPTEKLEAMTEGCGWLMPAGRTLARTALRTSSRGRLLLLREPPRKGRPLPVLIVQPGDTALWDNRFRVGVPRSWPAPAEVAALGAAGLLEVEKATRPSRTAASRPAPAQALHALPAFRRDGRVVAVPALAFAAPGLEQARAEFLARGL